MSRSSWRAGRVPTLGFILVLAFAPLEAVAAPMPPSGTYTFTVSRGGSKAGDSTITVKSAPPGLDVHEVETFPGITDVIDETLAMSDLSPTSYVSSFPLTADVGVTAHISFYSGGARETVDGTDGSTDFRAEPGTHKVLILDGVMMTGFFFLPAQLKAMSLTGFTVVSPSRADTYACRVDTGPAPPRPAGVPSGDTSVSIDGQSPSGDVEFTEWYDPGSMTVDEVDVPGQQVTIARVRR